MAARWCRPGRTIFNSYGPTEATVCATDGSVIFTSVRSGDLELWRMDADGKNARALTEKLDRSPSGMMWAPDASGVYFNVENEGSKNLYFVSLKGDVRQVTKGTHVLTVSDLNKNFTAVGVAREVFQQRKK